MDKKIFIQDFFKDKKIAFAGVSSTGKAFSNSVYKELKEKGIKIFPINPKTQQIESEPCYADFKTLPERTNSALFMTSKNKTLEVIRNAHESGIKYFWIQQGAETEDAINYCKSNDLSYITKECVMMYAEPVKSIHSFHRFLKKLFGKLY